MINKRLVFMMGPAVALLAFAQPAVAQVELGLDAGLSISSIDSDFDTDNIFEASIPIQRVRAGFFLSPKIEIEPAVSLTIIDAGDETLTVALLATDLLIHFGEDTEVSRFFVAVGPSLAIIDVGDFSETQFALGADIGVKTPASNQLLFRIAAGYTRWFETDDSFAVNEFGLSFGFSFMLE